MYSLPNVPLPVSRRCTRCRCELTAEAIFCGACGQAVPPVTPAPAVSETDALDVILAGWEESGERERERPLRTGEIVLIELVSWLPLINLIAWLIWMFYPGKNAQRARIAQSKLIVGCVLLVGAAAVMGIMAALVDSGVLESLPLPSLEWPF